MKLTLSDGTTLNAPVYVMAGHVNLGVESITSPGKSGYYGHTLLVTFCRFSRRYRMEGVLYTTTDDSLKEVLQDLAKRVLA
jgi:hypothetical protein